MKDEEKIKLLAKDSLFGYKKFQRTGGSYAIIVPREWLEWKGTQIDGEYYGKLNVVGEDLVITVINKTELDGLTMRRK